MRALNMQSLTNDIERWRPGVTIWGKGDAAHALSVSGHNEDDTPGVRAEMQDSDSKREHRAIDIMVRGPFTKADGDALVARLLADPAARARIYYIIWYGYIYSRSSGWKKIKYNGSDQHKDHVHISGWAADDDNTASWPAVHSARGGVSELFCNEGDNGEAVGALQVRLKNMGFYTGEIDEDYGPKTTAALKAACKKANPASTASGKAYDKYTMYYVDRLLIEKYAAGTKGPKGDPGPAGPPGPPGELKLPASLVFKGTLEQGS